MSREAALTERLPLANNTALSQALWVMLFAGATAVGAQIEVPHQPVPYTLQTLFVLLAGALLGARNGALSQLTYLAVGALGAPVFASGGFGIVTFAGPTGGYLLAFPLAAALAGFLVRRSQRFLWTICSMAIALLALFTSGTCFLYAFYMPDFSSAFNAGFFIFSWWDALKVLAAASIYREIARRLTP